jgi:hypothetical protein
MAQPDIQEVWPLASMDLPRKLNAATRFVVLISVVFFVLTSSVKFVWIGLVGVAVIAVYYNTRQVPAPTQEAFTPQNLAEHTVPTVKNPLMNVLLPELSNPDRKKALLAYYPETEKMIKSVVKEGVLKKGIDPRIFRGTNNEMDLDYSMRNFHTMPNSTNPNDQEAFGDFCYGEMRSAKEGDEFALGRNMSRLGSVPSG